MNKQDKVEMKDIVTNAVRGIDARLGNLEQNIATKTDIARIETRLDKTASKSDVRKLRKEIREGYLRVAKLASSTPTRSEFDELKSRVALHHPMN